MSLFDEMAAVRLDDGKKEFSVIISETDTVIYHYKIDGLSKEQVLEVIASQKACEELLTNSPTVQTVNIDFQEILTSLDMVFKNGEPGFADQEK